MGKTFSDIDLARYFSGESTPEEKQAIEVWRIESKGNHELFDTARLIWERALQAGTLEFGTEEALTKVHGIIDEKDSKTGRKRNIKLYVRIIAVAAAILLPMLIIFNNKGRRDLSSTTYTSYASLQSVKQIKLADGSLVWLNKNSTLYVPTNHTGGDFNLKLEGEAYFQVAHDPSRVFQVETSSSLVKVRGTAFNLKAMKNGTKIVLSVTDGKVAFSPKTASVEKMVVKGKEATLVKGKEISVGNISDENLLSWKTRILRFRDTPLRDVVFKLNDFYQIHFEISDSSLNSLPFSSTINNRPADEVIKLLKMARDDIEVTHNAQGYFIGRKK